MKYSYWLLILAAGLQAGLATQAYPGGIISAGQRGSVRGSQGYLGIDVRDVAEEQLSSLKLKEARGAEIIRVDHDGPAGKMGLREHDVVLQMNGVTIEGEDQIRRLLREMSPGRTVVLIVSREGQTMTMTAQMGDRGELERDAWQQHLRAPASPQAPASALPSGESFATDSFVADAPETGSRYSKSFLGTLLTSSSYTGAMLEIVGSQLAEFFGVPGGAGLLVRSVAGNSPAAAAGLHAGDIVVRVNAGAVASLGEWAKAIKESKGRSVSVTVLRDRQEKTLIMKLGGKRRSSLELPVEQTDRFQTSCLTEF